MDAPSGSIGEAAAPVTTRRVALWLALLVPAGLLSGALGSEHLGGLHPCEMCHWQRYGHWLGLSFATLALLIVRLRTPLLLLAAFGIAVSGAIGVFHAGVEYGWWQGFTSCTATGAASIEDLLAAPIVRCDQVQWSLMGLSMAGWNALISLFSAGVIVWLTLRRR